MTGWMVVYSLKTIRKIKGEELEIFSDHFEPFIEFDELERTPKEQALERYQELLQVDDVYSVNAVHIKESTEPHYLDVEWDDTNTIKKKKKE